MVRQLSLLLACFNPRTHEGCDCALHFFRLQKKQFQSTHPRGVRLSLSQRLAYLLKFQSTHPRGVRLRLINNELDIFLCFNPRTHEGCDSVMLITSDNLLRFQSTHPRGVRPYLRYNGYHFSKFQSTHPRGVRHHT